MIILNVLIVNKSMKYSLVQQQFKGNPLLHFHGNTELADSYSYTTNKKETYHCISTATMVMQRAAMSHYMCTVYRVKHVIKLNSVALVRTRTIPTERPPLVGEVSANFCG